MQSLEPILLRVVQLSLLAPSSRGSAEVAPLRDMLAATFARLFPGQARGPFDDLLAPIEPEHTSPAALLIRLLEQLAARPAGPPDEGALNSVSDALDMALALVAAHSTSSVAHLAVRLSNAAVFDYLAALTVEPRPGEPPVVIVGAVPPSLGRFAVKLPGRQLQLRKTTVAYGRSGIYPSLDIALPSACVDGGLQLNRTAWLQREHADARLELFTHELRPCGRISTMRATLPYTVEGARLGVALEAGFAVLTTHILDAAERELGRIVKVVGYELDR